MYKYKEIATTKSQACIFSSFFFQKWDITNEKPTNSYTKNVIHFNVLISSMKSKWLFKLVIFAN